MRWVSERDLLKGGGVRVFCLPHAGSGAAGYYRWRRVLAGVCPVMLPGREVRLGERALVRVEDVVGGLMGELRGVLEEPYAVFGHSMGALLAFEWVKAIEAAGLPGPVRLFVSGREGPQRVFGHRGLHRMDDAGFVAGLQERYGRVPEGFLEDEELREVFLPILRADLEVVETYAFAGGGLRCPVRAFAGITDVSVSEEGLLGWAEMTSGGFAARRFAGGHFYHLEGGQNDLLRVIAAEVG